MSRFLHSASVGGSECVGVHDPPAWMLLHPTTADVPRQRAVTRVSNLSRCGAALFDDKRVMKTHVILGDQLLSRGGSTASTECWAVTGLIFFQLSFDHLLRLLSSSVSKVFFLSSTKIDLCLHRLHSKSGKTLQKYCRWSQRHSVGSKLWRAPNVLSNVSTV